MLLLLLLGLTSCVCAGTFVVNVTQTSCQEEEGRNVTLEWTFTTEDISSPTSINVFCKFITRRKILTLFEVRKGVEAPESQDEPFAGRVQFDKDVLREGRVRLHLSRLRTEDSGLYRCDVLTKHGVGVKTCRLNVTAAAEVPRPGPRTGPEGPERPERPPEEGGTIIGLYVGLPVAALIMIVIIGFILYRRSIKCGDMKKTIL